MATNCGEFGTRVFEELKERFGELYSKDQFRCIAQLDVVRAVEAVVEAGYAIEGERTADTNR